MKTPIQIAIEKIENEMETNYYTSDQVEALAGCMEILTELLPTEREVIEEAYIAGFNNARSDKPFEFSEQYYTQTFKVNQ